MLPDQDMPLSSQELQIGMLLLLIDGKWLWTRLRLVLDEGNWEGHVQPELAMSELATCRREHWSGKLTVWSVFYCCNSLLFPSGSLQNLGCILAKEIPFYSKTSVELSLLMVL